MTVYIIVPLCGVSYVIIKWCVLCMYILCHPTRTWNGPIQQLPELAWYGQCSVNNYVFKSSLKYSGITQIVSICFH